MKTSIDLIQSHRNTLKYRVDSARNTVDSLMYDLYSIKERLEKLSVILNKNESLSNAPIFNSLGEIQSRGPKIDVEISSISLELKYLKDLEDVLNS